MPFQSSSFGFWFGRIAVLAALILSSCATTGAIKADSDDSMSAKEESGAEAPEAETSKKDVPLPAEIKYTLGAGDALSFKVFRQPDLEVPSLTVEPDGMVSLPLAGELYVEGLTMPEFRKLVEGRLAEYIVRPQVIAYVNKVNSQKVFVLGEVGSPAVIKIEERLTLLNAILRCGGMTNDAKTDHVYLVRQGKAYDIDMRSVYQGNAKGDVPLANGDIIYVPPTGLADWSRAFSYIGKILSPIVTLESGIVLSQSVERVFRGEGNTPSVSIPAQ